MRRLRRALACAAAGLVFLLMAAGAAIAGQSPTVTVVTKGQEQGEGRGSRAGQPLFGYNEAWHTRAEMIGRAAEGGADVARVVLSWSAVEPQPGKWSWAAYDSLYRDLRAAGKQPIWVLADAPCWARSRWARCDSKSVAAYAPGPGSDAAWAKFAAEAARRYPAAAAIEIWNEPNLVDFFKPAPDPRRLAKLASAAGRAIDEVDPSMPVVLGGLAPIVETKRRKEIAYDEFLRAVYRAPGSPRWDAVAMHPFPAFDAGDEYIHSVVHRVERVRKALAEVGAAGTPIWVTEVGLSTRGPHPFSPRRQAGGLVKVYRRLSKMPDVPAVVVHRLVDQAKSTTAESGWGVLQSDGDPKPAFCALAKERGASC